MIYSQLLSLSLCLSRMVLLKYSKYQQVVDFTDRSLPGYLVHLWTGNCVCARDTNACGYLNMNTSVRDHFQYIYAHRAITPHKCRYTQTFRYYLSRGFLIISCDTRVQSTKIVTVLQFAMHVVILSVIQARGQSIIDCIWNCVDCRASVKLVYICSTCIRMVWYTLWLAFT